jgi:hypothetical protein
MTIGSTVNASHEVTEVWRIASSHVSGTSHSVELAFVVNYWAQLQQGR